MDTRKRKITGLLLCLLSLIILGTALMAGGDEPNDTFGESLFSIDREGIHRLDPQTGSQEVIFSTSGMYMVQFIMAPSEALIAVLITEPGFTPPGAVDYSVFPRNHMEIIDTSGIVLAKLDADVRKFAWSPDGTKIAYIAGTYYEGGIEFITTGVGVFDIASSQTSAINKDFPHKALNGYTGGEFKINWARHDGNIYLEDMDHFGGAYCYDPDAGRSMPLARQGIDFSPDGTYYRETQDPEGGPRQGTHIFLTATDENITDRLIKRFGPDWDRVSLSWVFDRGNCLHVIRQSNTSVKVKEHWYEWPVVVNVLYDVERDSVVREITWPISRWTAGPDKLVLEKDGKFEILTYEDVYGK